MPPAARSSRLRASHRLVRAVACAGLLALSACGSKDVCPMPDDQRGAFMPELPTDHPVRVRVDQRFSAQENGFIGKAVSVWNQYAKIHHDRAFFSFNPSGVDAYANPVTQEFCGKAPDDRSFFYIAREDDDTNWRNLRLDPNVPGVTIRCYGDHQLTKQVVVIQTNHLGMDQFMSIVLHELGHAVGLDHSCQQGPGRDDYRSCDGLADNHPYRLALMHPVFRVGVNGVGTDIKENLRGNDVERANCLYRDR
jgi:hypothetical protein